MGIFCVDYLIINYNMSRKLNLIGNGEFNHLTIFLALS